MNKVEMNGYKRITRKEAEKLWNENKTFYIDSNKMVPGNTWGTTQEIAGERMQERKEAFAFTSTPFKSFVNNFQYYNCDNERGRYAAFYVKA